MMQFVKREWKLMLSVATFWAALIFWILTYQGIGKLHIGFSPWAVDYTVKPGVGAKEMLAQTLITFALFLGAQATARTLLEDLARHLRINRVKREMLYSDVRTLR